MNKKTIACACILVASGSPLFAGTYSAPAPSSPAPAPIYDDSRWYLGGGGEYFFDSEEVYWNGHIGYKFGDASSIFLEGGWIGEDYDDGFADVDVDIVPITLNYKYQRMFAQNLGWYIGVGAGAANLDVSVDFGGGNKFDDDNWAFAAQAFTGLVFEFTPSFEAYLGVRYLWIDETEVFGADIEGTDDVSIGLGLRFNF